MKIDSRVVDVFPFRIRGEKLEFLVLQMSPEYHKDIPVGKVIWQAVHGLVEADETIPQAGLREFREETGLEPVVAYQLDDVHVQRIPQVGHAQDRLPVKDPKQEDWIDLTVAFAVQCRGDAEPTLSIEHVAYKWLIRDEAEQHLRVAAHRRALLEIEKGFRLYNFENMWKIL
jgi:8-oxo-dGTP pyrophosphatase MutT (NUDIX family)